VKGEWRKWRNNGENDMKMAMAAAMAAPVIAWKRGGEIMK
jgi:hypothetical protein